MRQQIHFPWTSRKLTEVMCSIHTEFGVTMKLVKLIKMCLNKTCSKVHVGETLAWEVSCPKWSIRRKLSMSLLLTWLYNMPLERSRKMR
jgi:hypothetical protein